MEVAKLVLEYIKALAWPITVTALGLASKSEIKATLARIRRADLPGGFEINFKDEIRETAELASRVETAPTSPGRPNTAAIPLTEANSRMIALGLTPTPSGLDMGYYKAISARDPTLALAGLRIELEILTRNLAKGFKIDASPRESPSAVLRRLRDASAVTPDQFALGQRVLSLANQAIHGRTVSKNEADEILDAASALVDDYLAWLSWGFNDNWIPPRQTDQQ